MMPGNKICGKKRALALRHSKLSGLCGALEKCPKDRKKVVRKNRILLSQVLNVEMFTIIDKKYSN
jgi:hypothetical protein